MHRAGLLAVAIAAAAGIASLGWPSPASAAGCFGPGPIVLGPGSQLRHSFYCPNFAAPVYGPGPRRIDTLRTTTSWFVCQYKSGAANPPFGAGRNHWWLWTAGDDYGRYGWFPANAIKIGRQEQPIPGVPVC